MKQGGLKKTVTKTECQSEGENSAAVLDKRRKTFCFCFKALKVVNLFRVVTQSKIMNLNICIDFCYYINYSEVDKDSQSSYPEFDAIYIYILMPYEYICPANKLRQRQQTTVKKFGMLHKNLLEHVTGKLDDCIMIVYI